MGIWPLDHYHSDCHYCYHYYYYYYALVALVVAALVVVVAVVVVVVVFVPALVAGLAEPCRAWSRRAERPSRGW